MIKSLVLAFTVFLLGCATTPSPQDLELRKSISETLPTCSYQKECEVKWSAARTWVLANSGWKLQHVQPDFMETYNSVDGSTSIAVRVIKQPRQDGSYAILASIWCANIFGCYPDKFQALKSFHDYVNASWKDEPLRIGIQFTPVISQVATMLKMPTPRGVIVTSVTKDSIADRAGIIAGDVILAFASKPTNSNEELQSAVSRATGKEKTPVLLWRNNGELNVDVQF